MIEDYKNWLKQKGYAGPTYFNDAKKIENDYNEDLYNHFINGTYQGIINSLTYSIHDERNNKPDPSNMKYGELKKGLNAYLSVYKSAANNYLQFLKEQHIETLEDYQSLLDENIKESLADTTAAREKRLKSANPNPQTRIVKAKVYDRNPDVVAQVLKRANGICESCKNKAPFIRATNGTPYLEVHHKIPLANGGEDTIENAIALCPNCHRKAHHG